MIRFDVWLSLPEGDDIQCGELAFSDPDTRGRYRSAFRYTAAYLAHPLAFPLDARVPTRPKFIRSSAPQIG